MFKRTVSLWKDNIIEKALLQRVIRRKKKQMNTLKKKSMTWQGWDGTKTENKAQADNIPDHGNSNAQRGRVCRGDSFLLLIITWNWSSLFPVKQYCFWIFLGSFALISDIHFVFPSDFFFFPDLIYLILHFRLWLLFHQDSSRDGSEPVPNVKPVLCVSTAKELALSQENWSQSGANTLLV